MRTPKHVHTVDSEVHAIFCEWARWHRTRKRFANLGEARNHLWSLAAKSLGGDGPPDAELSAELNALNIAITSLDARSQNIVMSYYLLQRAPVKILAYHAKLQRSQFYEALRHARRRAFDISQRFHVNQSVRSTPDTIDGDAPDRKPENLGLLIEAE